MTRQEEQNDTLRDCAERFERLGIAYMLTGSMALVHYAMPRMTADIDIVIEVSTDDADKLLRNLSLIIMFRTLEFETRFTGAKCSTCFIRRI